MRRAGGVGQLLWWVNFLMKQCVPTHRPISFHARAAQPARGRRGSFLVYQKKDPHPAGDEIFVPAGDLFPAGQKPINLSRVRPTIGPPVSAATVWPSPKKGPISILPLKTRSAEIEFLRADKQLGKFPHTVGSRRQPRPRARMRRPVNLSQTLLLIDVELAGPRVQ